MGKETEQSDIKTECILLDNLLNIGYVNAVWPGRSSSAVR